VRRTNNNYPKLVIVRDSIGDQRINELLKKVMERDSSRNHYGRPFRKKLEAVRLACGLSQEQVAEAMGVETFVYEMMETSKLLADTYSMAKMYQFFDEHL